MAEGRERWRERTRSASLKAAPERRERFETSSGIEIQDLYGPEDVEGLDVGRDLGYPHHAQGMSNGSSMT